MIRSRSMAAAVVALAAATGVAEAQQTNRQVIRRQFRGDDHEFVIPAGWSGEAGKGDAYIFHPPPDRVKSPPLTCILVAVERQKDFNLPAKDVAEWLANEDKKEKYPSFQMTEASEMQFAGAPGSLLMLHGTDSSGVQKVVIYVVSVAPKSLYYMRTEGTFSDVQGLVDDLDVIASGVRPIELSQASRSVVSLDDPVWGLNVNNLRGWDVVYQEDGYQLAFDGNPSARVFFTVQTYRNQKAFEKKLKGAQKTVFLGKPALYVEKAGKGDQLGERTYYVPFKKSALVVTLASADLPGAVQKRVPDLESAISVREPVALKNKGAKLQLVNGVSVSAPKTWKLSNDLASRQLGFRKGSADLSLYVFGMDSKTAWTTVPEKIRRACELDAKGKLTEREVPGVLNAKRSVMYQCTESDHKVVLVLSEGVYKGEPVFIKMVVEREWGSRDGLPLGEAAEFMMFLSFAGG